MNQEEQWWFTRKTLADGREAYTFPITFGRARIGAGPPGARGFEIGSVW